MISDSYASQNAYTNTSSYFNSLDIAAIFKAVQVISSEIQVDKLLNVFMQTIMESVEAQKALLLLPKDGDWLLDAIASIGECTIHPSLSQEISQQLPISIANFVKNSLNPVILNNATSQNDFISDPYFLQQYPQSLLCMPILYQNRLVRVLYLENNLTIDTFNHDILKVLDLLCSQAAISLENAHLYQQTQQSESRFKQVFEKASDATFLLDNQGFTDCNQAALDLFKCIDKKQLCSLHPAQLSPEFQPDSQSSYIKANVLIDEALAKGSNQFEWVHKRLDGANFWAEVKLTAISDQQNWLIHAIVRDISERKQVTQDLEEFQTKLTSLIDTIPIGVIEWNPDFLVVGWNPAVEKIFGYQAGEMLHKYALDIVPESDRVNVFQLMTALIQQRKANYSLNENITKDGKIRVCEWINTPLVDDQGNVMGIYSMVQDVTEKKRSEATIHQKTVELSQALQEIKKAQLQMLQNEKMAALGNLVAGIAHEINNPIGFLTGSLCNAQEYIQELFDHIQLYEQVYADPLPEIIHHKEDIELDFLSQDLPKLLSSMKVAIKRIQDISGSLRTFARADSAEKIAYNLHEGMESTLLILKYRLKASAARPEIIVVKEYGELPEVKCFLGQLSQVFMNILANAIDALDIASQSRTLGAITAKAPKIVIRTQALNQENLVRISIQDNGPGIPEAIKSKIFDNLFTTKEVGKGTGLGLAIARQIVEETHGGHLSCNSIMGEGTEFIIDIPVC
jgi:PAS domain S-box-containing protein